jgi:FtsZ-binding cell division protein ZapB
MRILVYIILILLVFTGCKRKGEDDSGRRQMAELSQMVHESRLDSARLQNERDELRKENEHLRIENQELKATVDLLRRENEHIRQGDMQLKTVPDLPRNVPNVEKKKSSGIYEEVFQ